MNPQSAKRKADTRRAMKTAGARAKVSPTNPPRAGAETSDSIGYRVRETFLNISRAFRTRVARHNVTSGQWYFLRALWIEEGVTQRQLSERVGTTEATTVTAIKLLIRNGWIVKAPHPADRRATTLYLTREGKKLRQRLIPYADEVNEIALRGFSDKEARTLNDMLVRIQTNIKNHENDLEGVPSGLDE